MDFEFFIINDLNEILSDLELLTQLRAHWISLLQAHCAFLGKHSDSAYVFHNGPLCPDLQPPSVLTCALHRLEQDLPPAPALPPPTSLYRLSGSLEYGICIADQWFLTSLIFQLTHTTLSPISSSSLLRIAAQLRDRQDGAFLLIEAADALPPWADDCHQHMASRLFVSPGAILSWLEPPSSPSQLFSHPSISISSFSSSSSSSSSSFSFLPLSTLSSIYPLLTPVPQPLQRLVDAKLAAVLPIPPTHALRLCLPSPLAALLRRRPALLGLSVAALLRAGPEHRPLRPPFWLPLDGPWVHRRVPITRAQFSALAFDPALRAAAHALAPLQQPAGRHGSRAFEMGAKIAAGFEWHLREALGQRGEGVATRMRDVQQGMSACQVAIQNALVGVFEGESAPFPAEVAAVFGFEEEEEDGVSDTEVDPAGMAPDDPEDWLEISPAEVDDILAKYAPKDEVDAAQASQISDDLSRFLTVKSTHEGMESETPAHGWRPVRLDPKRFKAIFQRDPLLEELILQLDQELSTKLKDPSEFLSSSSTIVAENMLNAVKSQREESLQPGLAETILTLSHSFKIE